jgi:hypothetical protein
MPTTSCSRIQSDDFSVFLNRPQSLHGVLGIRVVYGPPGHVYKPTPRPPRYTRPNGVRFQVCGRPHKHRRYASLQHGPVSRGGGGVLARSRTIDQMERLPYKVVRQGHKSQYTRDSSGKSRRNALRNRVSRKHIRRACVEICRYVDRRFDSAKRTPTMMIVSVMATPITIFST